MIALIHSIITINVCCHFWWGEWRTHAVLFKRCRRDVNMLTDDLDFIYFWNWIEVILITVKASSWQCYSRFHLYSLLFDHPWEWLVEKWTKLFTKVGKYWWTWYVIRKSSSRTKQKKWRKIRQESERRDRRAYTQNLLKIGGNFITRE